MSTADKDAPTEVEVPRARRVFSERYKADIIKRLDACSVLGEKGELLRREGLYSSTITRWRRQMAKTPKPKRGRPKKTALQVENEALKRQNEKLRDRLHRAETIIDVQKKLTDLLESMASPEDSESSG